MYIKRLAKESTLGCVNPAPGLSLAAGASSRNLGTTLSPNPVHVCRQRPKEYDRFSVCVLYNEIEMGLFGVGTILREVMRNLLIDWS